MILIDQTTASGLPFYDMFVPQKDFLSKISDDVIASDFWFGPLNQKFYLAYVHIGWIPTNADNS